MENLPRILADADRTADLSDIMSVAAAFGMTLLAATLIFAVLLLINRFAAKDKSADADDKDNDKEESQ